MDKIKYSFLVIVTMTLLLMLGCDKAVTSSNDDESIMPLTIGNSWSFEVSGVRDNYKYNQDLTIVGTKEIDSELWYYFFEEDPEQFMIRNDKNGIWVYEDGESILFWKYPVKKNENYCDSDGIDGNSVNITCIGKNVKYNEFNACVVYNVCESGDFIHRYYLKPGIGLVGWEFYMNGHFIEKSSLTSYTII